MQLTWNTTGTKRFETGIDHVVLYIPNGSGVYDNGVSWNGCTAVNETPSGAEANKTYADNQIYGVLTSAEEFAVTIECFTYPREFEQFDGMSVPVTGVTVGQQNRGMFGLSYRTKVGNDVSGQDAGYKLHLVWGLTASPSEKNYSTINESPEMIPFSYECQSVPVAVSGLRPTSVMTIDSTRVGAPALAALEELLYGSVSSDPSLPTPDAAIAIFEGTALATNVVVAGDVDSIDITGTTANYLFTVEHWDGDEWTAVVGGTGVNEAAAEALTLADGLKRVTLSPAVGYYIPAAQQEVFLVNVT